MRSLESFDIDLGPVEFQNRQARLAGTVLCGPQVPIHPERGAVAQLHRAWAREWDLLGPEQVVELAFEGLWTGCLGHRSPDVAAVASDYCLMYTVVDDLAERSFEAGEEAGLAAAGALNDFARILEGRQVLGRDATRFPRYEMLSGVVRSVGERIRANTTPSMYELFILGFRMYVRGVVQQIHLAASGVPVSRATQIYNRHLNVAVDPTIAVICGLAGIDYAIDSHPLFERVHIAITRASAVINDIISFPKEARTGTTQSTCHNLVAAHLGDLDRDGAGDHHLRGALDGVFDFHNNEMRDFASLGQVLIRADPVFEIYLVKALEVHRDWMDWCLRSPRYNVAPEDEADGLESESPAGVPERASVSNQ